MCIRDRNKAIDGLGLSVDNKNTLKEALNQDYGADITKIETKVCLLYTSRCV